MGYQIEVILTNGRKVNEVYNSKNIDFLNIIDEYDYEKYDFFLKDDFDLSTKELSSKKLMENIINGNTENYYTHLLKDKEKEKSGKSTIGAVYGYLERGICLHYGKVINRNKDNWPMLTQYLDEFENRNRSYFKRPYPLYFPHTFHIMVRELDEYQELYSKKIKAKFPDNAELHEDFAYIFDQARKENLNIFLCNY